MMRRVAGIFFGILAAGCAGCTTVDIRSVPPSAVLMVLDADGGVQAGQGVWIEDRVLTALHVLLDEDWTAPTSIVVGGYPVRFQVEASGDPELLNNEPAPDGSDDLVRRAEDWAALKLEGAAHRGGAAVLPGRGGAKPGETLYMVGADVQNGEREIRAVRLRVPRAVKASVPLPSSVSFARLPRMRDWRGWSGSFVGRYDEARDEWEFVGLAAAQHVDARHTGLYIAIVRPPEDVVERFFAGVSEKSDTGEPRVVWTGEAPEGFLPPGFRPTRTARMYVTVSQDERIAIPVCIAESDTEPGRVFVNIQGCDSIFGWHEAESAFLDDEAP